MGIPPPLDIAFGVDFGTQTEPWFSSRAHSSTQTVPSDTIDAEIQATHTQLPVVDTFTQTEPLDLHDVIQEEYHASRMKLRDNVNRGTLVHC